MATLIRSALNEEFISDVLAGVHSGPVCFHVGRGTVDGEVVGTGWVGWRRTLRDLAVMGGVVTRSDYRCQGVASTVCQALCDAYDRSDGKLLYLASLNEAALRIYRRLGFRQVVGQVCCRARGAVGPDDGFQPGQKVRSRPADWGDVAAIVPLYIWPHECVLVDVGIAFPSTRIIGPTRCVSIFWQMWTNAQADGHCWHVLENERGWLVASVTARRGDRPDGVSSVDFIWHPNYSEEGLGFVRGFVDGFEAETGAPCELVIARDDDWKLANARRFGFAANKGSAGSIRVDGRKVNLIKVGR